MAPTYSFQTRWLVQAKREEVYSILEDAASLTQWWPSVYLSVQIVFSGDEKGVGKRIDLWTRGWLPYTLRWSFEVTHVAYPNGFSLRASGDFEGTGVWMFTQIEDELCEVIYNWDIRVNKPLLKILTPFLRPVFSANHRWAMSKGLESLKSELLKRYGENCRKDEFLMVPDKI